MTAYHVTTPRKLARYRASGRILRPVRYWPTLETALRWAKRTGRTVICTFEPTEGRHYPLPDHRPARWTDEDVTEYEVMEVERCPTI